MRRLGRARPLFTAFPDLKITIEELVGEDNKVVARLRLRGTHLGPFAGMSPTGNEVEWEAMRIWCLADGKIVETWAVRDRLAVRQQLGAVPD